MAPTSKYIRCPLHNDGKHIFVEAWTDKCEFQWQWQLICRGCGTPKSDAIGGVAPVAEVEEAPTLDPPAFSLDNPADIARFVQVFFDAKLNWAEAIQAVLNTAPSKTHALVGEWAADERIQKAIQAYVASLNNEDMQRAWLLHVSQKLAVDSDVSGAVQSTALNIQKAARIIEKSEQIQHPPVQIRDLPDILEGIGAEKPVN